jgi:prepilin-type N-terminal cleavage/methylation domain-containing protein
MKQNNHIGFTLIELLIVVAIIAILAAIAIPNFLSAQTRAKVSRAKGEMRTIATGLEAYYTDNNAYPRWAEPANGPKPPGYAWPPVSWRLRPLTTPISYITRVPGPDPFETRRDIDGTIDTKVYDSYDYLDAQSSKDVYGAGNTSIGCDLYGRKWRLCSAGPDRLQTYGKSNFTGAPPNITWTVYGFYDPTNGTISNGDIVRLGSQADFYTAFALGFEPP